MPGGYLNQARMTIISSGGTASPIALGSAVAPFSTFANAGAVDQMIIPYSINDTNANVAEKGWGLYSATGSSTAGPNLTRNAFTNGGALVSLSTAAQVFIDPSVADLVQLSLVAHANLGGL
jgi:hypothetical protein